MELPNVARRSSSIPFCCHATDGRHCVLPGQENAKRDLGHRQQFKCTRDCKSNYRVVWEKQWAKRVTCGMTQAWALIQAFEFGTPQETNGFRMCACMDILVHQSLHGVIFIVLTQVSKSKHDAGRPRGMYALYWHDVGHKGVTGLSREGVTVITPDSIETIRSRKGIGRPHMPTALHSWRKMV